MNKRLAALLCICLVVYPPLIVKSSFDRKPDVILSEETEPPSPQGLEDFLTQPEPILSSIVIGKSYAQQKEAIANKQQKVARNTTRQKPPRTAPSAPKSDLKRLAEELVTQAFGAGQFEAFDAIVTRESGWNPAALNKSSGACGLPQSLPCSKLPQGINTSPEEQINWMIRYIKNRYNTPNQALAFWNKNHWY